MPETESFLIQGSFAVSSLLTMQTYLEKGMETLSQAEVGSALQIFFNLQDLAQVIHLRIFKFAEHTSTLFYSCHGILR